MFVIPEYHDNIHRLLDVVYDAGETNELPYAAHVLATAASVLEKSGEVMSPRELAQSVFLRLVLNPRQREPITGSQQKLLDLLNRGSVLDQGIIDPEDTVSVQDLRNAILGTYRQHVAEVGAQEYVRDEFSAKRGEWIFRFQCDVGSFTFVFMFWGRTTLKLGYSSVCTVFMGQEQIADFDFAFLALLPNRRFQEVNGVWDERHFELEFKETLQMAHLTCRGWVKEGE